MKKLTKLLSVCVLAGTMAFSGFAIAGCNKKPDDETNIEQGGLNVAVTGITLSGERTVKVNHTTLITPTVSPSTATDKTVTWSSSDTTIATVSEGGLVTGLKVGKVTITAKSTTNEITGVIEITVTDEQGNPPSGEDPDNPPSGEDPDNPPSGEDPDNPPSGEDPDNPPSGEDPDNPPSGEDPDNPPSGEDPDNPPSGEDPDNPPSGEDPDDPPASTGMTEAQFKAAIEASLAATNFTYSTDAGSVAYDGAAKASAVGDSYRVYDSEGNKIITYLPIGDVAWTKEEISVTDEATAKDVLAGGILSMLKAFKDADYSGVSYDEATGRYSVGGVYITFENGKVSAFGEDNDYEFRISNYGTSEITLPDFTNTFENIVSINFAKNAVGTKLAAKTETSSFGLFSEVNDAQDYVSATANGYKQTIASGKNKGISINLAGLEGKLEGYFEFSPSANGGKWDIVQIRSAGAKILSVRVSEDKSKFEVRKGDVNITQSGKEVADPATLSTPAGFTVKPADNGLYKVKYSFVKGEDGNYKATLIINGQTFVSDEDLGVDTLSDIYLVSGNSGARVLTIDNVIICGTPTSGSQVTPVASVTLNKTQTRIEQIGDNEILTATVAPSDATYNVVYWSSSDPSVATVDSDGKVTAVKEGTAIITAMASNGKSASCTVNVGAEKILYTITFVNGDETWTETAEKNGKVKQPKDITPKEGYKFIGWSTEKDSKDHLYNFDEPVEEPFTLYAVWEEKTGDEPDPVNPNPGTDPETPKPTITNAEISYFYAADEAAALEWDENNIAKVKVEYKLSTSGTYTEVDKELIRQIDNDTARVDILGLKGNATYEFRISTSGGKTLTESATISAYDRSGFAHFNYSDGVGAYNDDGTLKDKAIVLYVTDENKNTVSLTYKGTTVTGIGNILNSVGEDVGGGKAANGGSANTNQGIIKKLAQDNIPLVVRFIGCVSDSGLYKKATFDAASTPKINGLTIYDSTGNGGTAGDNGHMARIKSGKDITLEGVGDDAVIDGWGFHYMAESSFAAGGKSFEVRNLTFINTPEDAIGMEGVQASKNASSDLSASVERCWIHNNEFYGPSISNPAESDKSEGDGSCDFKRGQYFTCSYNYFEGCHKTNLVGSADYSLQFNLTYHHNYWKLCKARGPLTRRANVHMYNNVFEGQTDYAMNTRADAYIFSEYNLFYMCKSPQAVEGGAIKSYNDSFSSYIQNKGTIGTIVTSKSQIVPNNCQFAARNIDYSKFDTSTELSYIPSGDYILQTNVTEARKTIAARAGVRKRDDRLASDISLSELSYVPSDVAPQKITTYPSEVAPGKISKTVYAFTLDRSATVSISYASDEYEKTGVLLNEAGECLLTASGSINLEPGTYIVQATNFQPGDAKKLTGGTFKDLTINSISFAEYKSEEFDAKLLADYNTKAGLIKIDEISYDNASYQKIVNAKNAYDILSPELKAQVTVPYTTVTAAFDKYIELGKAEVERLINAIGTVTDKSDSAISKAREAYQALITLSPDVTISNYNTLVQAEAAYEQYAVIGVNNAIAALATPSTATTQEAIESLLDEYNAVKAKYETLDEEQRAQVTGYSKLTDGIIALEKALAPYEVKDMIEALPAKANVTLTDSAVVTAARKAYDALDAAGKAIVGDITKLTEAEEVITKLASESKVAIFDKDKTNLASDAGFTVSGKYKGTDQKYTYNGVEYASPLKMESDTSVKFTTAAKMKITIHLYNGAGAKNMTITLDGKKYTANENGDIEVEIEAGSHEIKRGDGEAWMCYVVLSPVA